jgi:hypothetical protein
MYAYLLDSGGIEPARFIVNLPSEVTSSFRVQVKGEGFRFRVERAGFMVKGSWFRVCGQGVQIIGFRIQDKN